VLAAKIKAEIEQKIEDDTKAVEMRQKALDSATERAM
jgi:hypothetical protein